MFKEYARKGHSYQTDLTSVPELVAIVSDEKVYIVNDYELGLWRFSHNPEEKMLPENAYRLEDVMNEKNTYITSVLFREFYDALETNDITDEYMLRECSKEARNVLFAKNPVVKEAVIQPFFNVQHVADYLCGIIDLEEEAKERFEKDRDYWIKEKSMKQKVKELMVNNSVAKDYEMKIAEGLRSVNAKYVTVVFEMDKKVETAKMNPQVIIQTMQENDYFGSYSFETTKRGKEVMEKLGASSWWGSSDGKKMLTCENIAKITYGKSVLYEKS